MSYDIMLLLVVAIPVLFSVLIPLLGKVSVFIRNFFALLLMVIPFIFLIIILQGVQLGIPIDFIYEFPMLEINFILHADMFAVFVAMASMLVSIVILIYSFEYIKSYENQNEYFFIVVLFIGSMMGIIFSANLIFIYVFWEMTALASWRLIGYFRETEYVRRANKAFLMTAAGALCMLIGFLMIAEQAGSFDLSVISSADLQGPTINLAIILIILGIFSKSATFPLHSWLADAGIAPSPVTALLHAAVLVKIGVYVYARLFNFTIVPSEEIKIILFTIVAISAFLSGAIAFVEKDIKRVIAFSTISQIAFIFLGFISGGKLAFVGAMLFILIHGVAKAGLFLSAGIIEHKIHTKQLDMMGGLFRYMPITALAFAGCALSVMGIPPFAGFFSKFLVIFGAVYDQNVLVALVFIVCAGLTVLYTVRLFGKIFLGSQKDYPHIEKENLYSPMVLSVVSLAVLSLLMTFSFGYLFYIANFAAQTIKG
jgi:NADH:ubiquinone oxidoreductase subunit 5 (subunit L)/multisubunit Na+/H+ antiporter MnhA subunit